MKTIYLFVLFIFLIISFIAYQYVRYLDDLSSRIRIITPEYPKLSSVFIEQNPWKPQCEEGYKIAYSLNLKYDEKEEGFIYGPLESVWCVIK